MNVDVFYLEATYPSHGQRVGDVALRCALCRGDTSILTRGAHLSIDEVLAAIATHTHQEGIRP